MNIFRFVLLFCLLLPSVHAAPPMAQDSLPDALKSWVPWVLYGQEQQRCPFLYNDAASRECLWPAQLALTLDATGGRFSQEWQVYTRGWVSLPGDAEHWPQQVELNGVAAAVTGRNGMPSLFLASGLNSLSGQFQWSSLPEALSIPPSTGLLALTLNGAAVAFPELDGGGKLWLQRRSEEGAGVDRLELSVQRLLSDDIPFTITTQITLDVSGKNREILLGKALLADFVPISLQTPLPARVEPDGRLRVQARPGHWVIDLVAYRNAPLDALNLLAAEGPWAQDEVWAFEAQPELRQVEPSGVAAIDPQQTTLPDEWKQFPAYRLRAGDTLTLLEKRRGDPQPAPDQLSLQRNWWLDLDGGGFTIQDQISGALNRSWRLEMNAPFQLGRVAVDGRDQFITRLAENPRSGVEIRQGSLQLNADSRLPVRDLSLPAVGWEQDFSELSGVLNLPPGWRLLHASGVDQIDTWITRWSLLDIFLVLIIALSTGKLWGWRWGGLALLTLILIYHEGDAPVWIWLNLLAAAALLRLLPQATLSTKNRARQVIEWYRRAALLALVIIALPFMVQQLRLALYPTLEQPWQVIGGTQSTAPAKVAQDSLAQTQSDMVTSEPEIVTAEADMAAGQTEIVEALPMADAPLPTLGPAPPAPVSSGGISASGEHANSLARIFAEDQRKRTLSEPDPNAQIQTGPGLPQWQWQTLDMRWSGPVLRDQQLTLWLLPPWANLLLAFARVALLIMLMLRMLDRTHLSDAGPDARPSMGPGAGSGFWRRTAPVAMLFLLVSMAPLLPTPAQADTPSPELLQELRQRLLPAPECVPECASSARLGLEISASELRLRMDVQTAQDTVIPLPGQARDWLAQQIWLDGLPVDAVLRKPEGVLWLAVPQGQHQLLLSGSLPPRETVQLALNLQPHRLIVTRQQGWDLGGLHEDGLADDTLQLTRQSSAGDTAKLEAGSLPPLLRIERLLSLGLNWQVETRVQRLSPNDSAVLLAIPLLDGESVVSDGARVENGKLLINLAAGQSETSWNSVLKQSDHLQLRASQNVPWVEQWRVDVAPLWHVTLQGIPLIHQQDDGGRRLPVWRPWPGEEISLAISRPEGVPGQTLTLDSSVLKLVPGLRASDATLDLSLRSSRGGQQPITLPTASELQSVTINGQSQPIRQDSNSVSLPLVPGAQLVQLQWREARGITTHYRTSPLNLGLASVNTTLELVVPNDRWILLAGGPRLGPALLFWGMLLVIVLVAIALGRVRLTPLKTRHWLLLGLGLSQAGLLIALLVVGWLLVLGWRERQASSALSTPLASPADNRVFNLRQIGLAIWTLLALAGLFSAVQTGLLGQPDMQIIGNGSSSELLRWYQDRSTAQLPQAWMISLPLLVYRGLMLAWALWLAYRLLSWLRWGWDCYSKDGLWRRVKAPKTVVVQTEVAGDA